MRKVALALACSFVLLPLADASAQSRACRDRVYAKGTPNLLKFRARSKARSAWSEKVGRRFGDQYTTWRNARDSRVDCDKEGARHVCRASARPCRA